ncbi:MAG TPA: carboxypeptidase-like regulatory domain-containing protein [Candidatus Acidoferrum sp.]|nr:carboxypeptidase-like regulatory domain-containing protein [Candidatus Acidoferrum sp.]
MRWKAFRAPFLIALGCVLAPASFAQREGRISGVVLDAKGTPQMGATVLVASEHALNPRSLDLLTNARGRFSTATIPPGSYTVKVSLAGFLPAMEQHIRVSEDRVTLMQVVLGSVFSSFGELRQEKADRVSPDDWTWVLRSAPDTRSVLRWTEGPVLTNAQLSGVAEAAEKQADHLMMQLTSGADHPGSVGAAVDSPATTFLYDMGVGETARLLMAGQFSYSPAAPAGGFVAEWLPSGSTGSGHVMMIEAREAQFGPIGPVFRGLRISDSDALAIGDRVSIRYGAEFVAAGLEGTTQSLRPHGELAVHVTPTWMLSGIVAAQSPEGMGEDGAVQTALNNLDDFPILMMRDGSPVLENDWHEEFSVDHALMKKANIEAAIFHDQSTHTALIGRGGVGVPGFLQDYYSSLFAYDGGGSSSGGARVAYRQRLTDGLSTTLVYAYAGALAPDASLAEAALRDELSTQYRNSVAGRVTARIPRLGTEVSTGYEWISGPAVSQVDSYGESLYQIDPYLSMELRQPLPKALPCRVELVADAGNLLAQGYVPLSTTDGRVVLVSSYRFFRGGLSVQF